MPSVSKAQEAAMHAAADGHSTIGIPESVGKDFAAADAGHSEKGLPEHASHVRSAIEEHKRGMAGHPDT